MYAGESDNGFDRRQFLGKSAARAPGCSSEAVPSERSCRRSPPPRRVA
jgi:hypothetical protein